MPPRRFVFTGAPGSGKTSVIDALGKMGHTVIREAATDVIAQEQATGVERPWEDQTFVDKVVSEQKKRQIAASQGLQFYDRSPFCTYALSYYLSQVRTLPFVPSRVLREEIDRCLHEGLYQNRVFFFENFGFIEHTAARKISYDEALIFERMHDDIYTRFGFTLIAVSHVLNVEQRCAWILDNLEAQQGG